MTLNSTEPTAGWKRLTPLLLLLLLALGFGCDRSEPPGSAAALYPKITASSATRSNVISVPPPAPALTNASLTVLQTELFPATLWHTRESSLSLFSNLEVTGLGGPAYLAYSSPTGIAVAKPGVTFAGDTLRENWLLVGFPGSRGWTEWDSPWAVFLQRRPSTLEFSTQAVHLTFEGAGGFLAMMPLYGYYKPPQKGHEFLSRHGLKDKKLSAWEWNIALARDPLTRLRYWSGATRQFPYDCQESIRVDHDTGSVVFQEDFAWIEIPDDWGTDSIRVAPVSPSLGFVCLSEKEFPAGFSKRPFDFELPTPFGPFFGVPNVDGYRIDFSVLNYIRDTESSVASVTNHASPLITTALERLRGISTSIFGANQKDFWVSSEPKDLRQSILEARWYAMSLPYLEPDIRTNAIGSLSRFLRERVLVSSTYNEREYPPGSGRSYLLFNDGSDSESPIGAAGNFSATILESVWAYAHYSGDYSIVQEQWPLLRRLFTPTAQGGWPAFGRYGVAVAGDEASPAIAFARLAYLAGDLDSYHYGCGWAARGLVHHYLKQRGGHWFQEQQPWHSMEPLPGRVYPAALSPDFRGWQLAGPNDSRGERGPYPRWARFQDLDVARFYRDYLAPEVRNELNTLLQSSGVQRGPADDGIEAPTLVRLHSLLLNASTTNLAAIATREQFTGTPVGIVASCLAVIRSAHPPRYQRLIPETGSDLKVSGWDRGTGVAHPEVTHAIQTGTEQAPEWPRMVWPTWKAPGGGDWNFGEVRPGSTNAPRQVRRTALGPYSIRTEFEQ